MLNDTILNFSLRNINSPTVTYSTKSLHAISLFEIFLAALGYVILCVLYIKFNRDKDKYCNWTNPKGRKIDLVKLIRMYMILYPIVIILLSVLQIWLFSR
jgi:hypothetical protein